MFLDKGQQKDVSSVGPSFYMDNLGNLMYEAVQIGDDFSAKVTWSDKEVYVSYNDITHFFKANEGDISANGYFTH